MPPRRVRRIIQCFLRYVSGLGQPDLHFVDTAFLRGGAGGLPKLHPFKAIFLTGLAVTIAFGAFDQQMSFYICSLLFILISKWTAPDMISPSVLGV